MWQNIFLIIVPLVLMVVGQVMSKTGAAYASFFNIFVMLGYVALIARGIIWIFTLKRLPISFAYPVMSISFVLVLLASRYFFNEEITVYKVAGSILIIAGVIFTSLGKSVEEG